MNHFLVKKGGKVEEGQISRDTCSIGNHLLEESKNSHKAVSASGISCWIQREGRRGWRTVAECLFRLFHFPFIYGSGTVHQLSTCIENGYCLETLPHPGVHLQIWRRFRQFVAAKQAV